MKKPYLLLIGLLLSSVSFATELRGGKSLEEVPNSFVITITPHSDLQSNSGAKYIFTTSGVNSQTSNQLYCSMSKTTGHTSGFVFVNKAEKGRFLTIENDKVCNIALQCLASGRDLEIDLNPRKNIVNEIILPENCPNYLLPEEGIFEWADGNEEMNEDKV